MKNLKWGCNLVAILIILALIGGWRNVMMLSHQGQLSSGFIIMLVSFYLLFNIVAAWGLFLQKSWGFLCTYLAVVYSTVFFSISYIPLITHVMAEGKPRLIALIICNLIVLVYTMYLDYLSQQDD